MHEQADDDGSRACVSGCGKPVRPHAWTVPPKSFHLSYRDRGICGRSASHQAPALPLILDPHCCIYTLIASIPLKQCACGSIVLWRKSDIRGRFWEMLTRIGAKSRPSAAHSGRPAKSNRSQRFQLLGGLRDNWVRPGLRSLERSLVSRLEAQPPRNRPAFSDSQSSPSIWRGRSARCRPHQPGSGCQPCSAKFCRRDACAWTFQRPPLPAPASDGE